MDDLQKQQAIESYIKAYNAFDIAGMVKDLHPEVVFENISGGKTNLRTEGIAAFRKQAEQATAYFQERAQQATSIKIKEDVAEVEIAYRGVLAVDLPNGMKAGNELVLQGKSLFSFEEGKIIKLQDIS